MTASPLSGARPGAARPTICLNMIVKNESGVIRRCLDSVKPFVDAWAIVDTGSTDGTQQIVREHMRGLPGELHERPWKDFGHNRTEALELARARADYTMVIDADEVFLAPDGFRWPPLSADEYQIRHQVGDSQHTFFLTQLVRSALPWRYVGVLHEVIVCDEPHGTSKIEGPVTRGHFDGARNADPRKKYESDAAVLERALGDEPDNARYVFYLAQSLRDAGQLDRSLVTYERRAAMGGWPEEVWYSLFQVGVLAERAGRPPGEVVDAHLKAYAFRPRRAEPLCELARHYRERGLHAAAHVFACAAVTTPRPDDILFLDESVYAWRALDEYGVSSYWVGKHRESLAAADRLLSEGKLPAHERARVEANRQFCLPHVLQAGRKERNVEKKRRKGKRR
jgi:tetratricopeptide (TPR) repeat protein